MEFIKDSEIILAYWHFNTKDVNMSQGQIYSQLSKYELYYL